MKKIFKLITYTLVSLMSIYLLSILVIACNTYQNGKELNKTLLESHVNVNLVNQMQNLSKRESLYKLIVNSSGQLSLTGVECYSQRKKESESEYSCLDSNIGRISISQMKFLGFQSEYCRIFEYESESCIFQIQDFAGPMKVDEYLVFYNLSGLKRDIFRLTWLAILGLQSSETVQSEFYKISDKYVVLTGGNWGGIGPVKNRASIFQPLPTGELIHINITSSLDEESFKSFLTEFEIVNN